MTSSRINQLEFVFISKRLMCGRHEDSGPGKFIAIIFSIGFLKLYLEYFRVKVLYEQKVSLSRRLFRTVQRI
jgi:hypothetical protein